MEILQDELMSKHTSFKIGGKADYYMVAKTVEDVKEAIKFSKEKNLELTVIGNGTNVLVRDGGIRGVVLKIAIDYTEVGCRKSDDGNIHYSWCRSGGF